MTEHIVPNGRRVLKRLALGALLAVSRLADSSNIRMEFKRLASGALLAVSRLAGSSNIRTELKRLALGALLAVSPAFAGPFTGNACAVVTSRSTGGIDTARIQEALNLCSPGQAVVLEGGRFESGPLILPRGVTLFLERGVTLYASRNPRHYDLKPGACGVSPPEDVPVCKPFLFAYQAAYSGVVGAGVIDGQGQAWWKKSSKASVPDLVSSYESQGFRMEGVTLRNAAGVHAAIFKTIGLEVAQLKVDSPAESEAGAGLLLSNVVDATVTDTWIRGPAEGIALKASILGPTTGVKISGLRLFGGQGIAIGDNTYGAVHDIEFDGVGIEGARVGVQLDLKGYQGGDPWMMRGSRFCLHGVAEPVRVRQPDGRVLASLPAGREMNFPGLENGACENPAFTAAPQGSAAVDTATVARYGQAKSLVVSADGPLRSIQQAVDALPAGGGEITVKPGTYREVVTIRKPHVHLHGEADDPAKTVVVFGNGAPTAGGTFNTATLFVEADDVTLEHLTIANDFGFGKGQGVALAVTADRAIFRKLRLLAAQDTLFAASRYCYGDYGPCVTARQYFEDCYIEGNVDFIFGDSKAVFERCELHGIAEGNVMYTAQSKHTTDQESGYIFDHCRLTGAPRQGVISFGRPWRPYATVVFLHTRMDAPLLPAGWQEWVRFGKPSLPTTYYAEYDSTGPGANPGGRDPHAHQLTDAEARKWSAKRFLAGGDGWNPAGVR